MENELIDHLRDEDEGLARLAADMGIDPRVMSDQEKKVLVQILHEMATDGESETLKNLWYADYDEVPVDIDTFIEDPDYFGNGTDGGNLIYPFWRGELRKIFAPGNKYYEVCVTGGIGLGKSTIAVIGLGYSLHKLLCLKNPQEYYGLTKSSIIGIAFFNITLDQSYGVAYRKLQGFLKDSPWFLRNGTIRGLKNKVYKPNKGIEFVVGSSPSHGLGRDIFCLTGDSKIYTPEGVKSLKDVEGQEVVVMSYNPATDKFEWSEPALVTATGVRSDVYEIGFENETFMRCTGDHKVMVRISEDKTEYKEAKNLIPGDDVVSLN